MCSSDLEDLFGFAGILYFGINEHTHINETHTATAYFPLTADEPIELAETETITAQFQGSVTEAITILDTIVGGFDLLFTIKETAGAKTKHFAYDEADRLRICGELTAAGKNFKVGRNKGLGEMDVDELAQTALDPETRVLRRVTLDEAQAAAAFEVLMGREVGPRRDWIVERAAFVDREILDI